MFSKGLAEKSAFTPKYLKCHIFGKISTFSMEMWILVGFRWSYMASPDSIWPHLKSTKTIHYYNEIALGTDFFCWFRRGDSVESADFTIILRFFIKIHTFSENSAAFLWNLHLRVKSHVQNHWYSTRNIDVFKAGGRKCAFGPRKAGI